MARKRGKVRKEGIVDAAKYFSVVVVVINKESFFPFIIFISNIISNMSQHQSYCPSLFPPSSSYLQLCNLPKCPIAPTNQYARYLMLYIKAS